MTRGDDPSRVRTPGGSLPGAYASAPGSLPRAGASGAPRTIGSRSGVPARRRRGGAALSAIIVVLAIGVAAVWAYVTVGQLTAAIAVERADHLGHARATFAAIRARTFQQLRAQCRILVEDPRLKSTLATDGVDEATVADILGDLAKLRASGFLIVLAPDGKVFAEAGAPELRGLDLSGSSPVKKARTSLDAVEGSWSLGGKVMDLSIMGVRFGTTPVAYLVVGQAIDQALMQSVADQTGVAIASAAGGAVTLASSSDPAVTRALAAVAAQAGTFEARALELDGRSYLTAIFELEDAGQTRPRLVLVDALAPAAAAFETLRRLIFAAPLLIVIVVLFVITASRRVAVVRTA